MKKTGLFIILPLFILFSCRNNPLDVDISGVETQPLEVLRLERDLFSMNAANFETKSAEIKQKYGKFYEHFLVNPLRLNGTNDSLYKPMLLDFVTNKDVRESYAYTVRLYPDDKLNELAPEINDCVRRFKYHFPEHKLPARFITCITGWNYAFAYLDSALVISLDMYLGDTAKFYEMLRYPKYQTRKMDEHHLLPDIARGWILTEFDNSPAENNLLNHTIFYGKLYYAINALLPNTPDSLLIGYSSQQIKLCEKYEKNYWSYFAEKNRLYENNLNTIRELTSEGPFTGAISKECPPRIAMWIGWQIVRSYMKHNDNVTLAELMKEQDAQKILSRSKYRP